jgi:hypothetical protein
MIRPAARELAIAGLDNRLTDVRMVVSLTHQPRSAPQEHYFSAIDTYFC